MWNRVLDLGVRLLVNGKGGWMFYSHSNAAQTGIEHWWLIDLKAFNAILHCQRSLGPSLAPDGPALGHCQIKMFCYG